MALAGHDVLMPIASWPIVEFTPRVIEEIYQSLKARAATWSDGQLQELLRLTEVAVEEEVAKLHVFLEGRSEARRDVAVGHPGSFGVGLKTRGVQIENLEVLEYLAREEERRRASQGGLGSSQ